jgi:Fic family protein
MGIKYDGLFDLLKEKNVSKTQLQKRLGLSSTTLAKLSKNEAVSMKVIEDICKDLNCQPGDIISLENEKAEPKLLKMLKEEKDMKLKGGLYHLTQIKLAYNSNRIEGSKLSEDQTRYIYETNTIGMEADKSTNIDDIIETINHFQCFEYMLECAGDVLSETMIKNYHKILKGNTSDSRVDWFKVGDYKTKANMVGDSKTTPPAKVGSEIAKLLFEYNAKETITFEDIVEFHYDFEAIHPFQDGNGRVGRVIIFKECLKNGITPFIIENEQKQFYYRGLKEFKNEKGFLMDTCLSAQDRYAEIVKYFDDNIPVK